MNWFSTFFFRLRPHQLFIFIIIICGILLQSQIYLSHDVGWHLLTTQRFLQGGNYINDFVDINPPILMYTLIPPVLLSKWLSIDWVWGVRIYVFILAGFSYLLCIPLLETIVRPMPRLIVPFKWVLAFIFFILPIGELGQREHLFLILTLPYFLLIALRIISPAFIQFTTLIGIFAGVGFMVNIDFLPLLIVSEIYLAIKTKKSQIKVWTLFLRRQELVLIIIIGICYFLSILLVTPQYLHFILPAVFFLFLGSYNENWSTMLLSVPAFSFYFIFLLAIWHAKDTQFRPLLTIFLMIATILFCEFLLTRKLWYYHQIPLLAFALLLAALILTESYLMLLTSVKTIMLNAIKLIVVNAFLLMLPLFSIAAEIVHNLIDLNPHYDSSLTRIIQFVKKQGRGEAVNVLTTLSWPGLLPYYAHVEYGSRFMGLWMIPGILHRAQQSLTPEQAEYLKSLQHFQLSAMNKDFIRYQPRLVLVEKLSFSSVNYIEDSGFNYIRFFSQDSCFKSIWQHYRWQVQLGNYDVYQLEENTSKEQIFNPTALPACY